MSRPYAVILHITDKNCEKRNHKKLINLLKSECSFSFLGSSVNEHQGTTLIKSITADDVSTVVDAVGAQLKNIKADLGVRFECQLTVAASDVRSETIFIE